MNGLTKEWQLLPICCCRFVGLFVSSCVFAACRLVLMVQLPLHPWAINPATRTRLVAQRQPNLCSHPQLTFQKPVPQHRGCETARFSYLRNSRHASQCSARPTAGNYRLELISMYSAYMMKPSVDRSTHGCHLQYVSDALFTYNKRVKRCIPHTHTHTYTYT